jgi:hypothetical protein
MIPRSELLSLIIATSFAAGLNVYATVATLGLLARAQAVTLPPGLEVLGHWPIIAIAAALFVIEFFADKIPAFDLLWNALHTFIRVPVAALLAYRATAQLSPEAQVLCAIVGGAVALATHGSKIAARAAVTPSPEPVSNIALSTGEDVVAIGLTWFASAHPVIAAAIAVALLVGLVLIARWLWRGLRRLLARRSTAPTAGLKV